MNADETSQLADSLTIECQITSNQPSSTSPSSNTIPKQRYRPKPSSLPTSLIQTILLNDDGDQPKNENSNENIDDHNSSKIPTTFILQLFTDRIFLSITQLSGKIGSLFTCQVEESIIDNSTTYHVSTLLGTGVARASSSREVSVREVLVRRIAEKMVLHERKMAGVAEGSILGGGENGGGPIPLLVLGLGLRPRGGSGSGRGGGMMSVENFNEIVDRAMDIYVEGRKIREGFERGSGEGGGKWELPD